MSEFETGEFTKKSVEQIDQIIKDSLKRTEGKSIAEVRRAFNAKNELIGYELVHAERKPRSDKGTSRGSKVPPAVPQAQTEAKGAEQAQPADKSKDKKVEKKTVPTSPMQNTAWAGDNKAAS